MDDEVRLFGQLRDIAGVREKVVSLDNGARVIDLVDYLGKEYGSAFSDEVSHTQGLRIFISGREFWLSDAMNQLLQDRDTVILLPPIAGG